MYVIMLLGLSCEICAQGYMRSTTENDSYDTCKACDCNDNGQTDPPMCDENTGVCLNCRDGTIGEQCGSCASHVVQPACEVCEDQYYGISQEGCSRELVVYFGGDNIGNCLSRLKSKLVTFTI